MNSVSMPAATRRPIGVAVIAIANGIGFLITVLFWGLVAVKKLVPYPGGLSGLAERANAATTYGFMLGDIIWSVPLLLLAAIGVWRLRP